MPIFRNRAVLEIMRDVRVFLYLEGGAVRGGAPGLPSLAPGDPAVLVEAQNREREQTRRQLADRDREIAQLREQLRAKGVQARAGRVNPENIIWIFGTARTGSTWLASMMKDLRHHSLWDEPLVGVLFGDFHYVRAAHKTGKNSLLGSSEEIRSKLIRSFLLMAVDEKFPKAGKKDYLVIKEPNGSIGAPLLAEALPESRMIFLIRDPRDVVASNLSGHGEGGYLHDAWTRSGRKGAPPPKDPDQIVRTGAGKYAERIGRSKQAYDAHEGPKVLVRYEDLRADALGTMRRIYSELEIEVDEEKLGRVVEKHSWENIPQEERGPGKRNRKATPGGWREDLTAEQARTVEKITAPLLQEFYAQEASSLRKQLAERNDRNGGMNPENIIWICGTGRTGSTWLMNMMAEMPRTSYWNEPRIARLFGNFYDNAQTGHRNARNFVLGEPAKQGWIPLIRNFVMGSINYRRPDFGSKDYLVVKEPNASLGALFMVQALPESRMILLVRDPRDVVASFLDGMRKGSWAYQRRDHGKRGEESPADVNPDTRIRNRAKGCLKEVTYAKEAFESHKGLKTLVRYEDLRADTLGTMRRIYSELEIEVDEKELGRVVEKHSWENIPEEERGSGKKFRKATPGGWREDLTAEQARTVEEITAPLLQEFYAEK